MSLGENIYNLRTAKNMSQENLAEQLEVSRQSVSKWENDSAVPELDKLMHMAEVFEISLDELVTGVRKENPAPTPAEQPRVINENSPEVAFLSIPLFIIGTLMFVLLPGHFISWLVGVPALLAGLFVVFIGVDSYIRERKKQADAPAVTAAHSQAEPPAPGVVVHAQFPTEKILGIVLMALGALAVILGLALPSMAERDSRLLLTVGLCGIVCGVFCLCVRYPQLFCGWTAWAGYLVYVFTVMPRWEEQTLLLILAGIGLVGMLVWTVRAQQSGKAQLPKWLLVLGAIVLALLVVMFFLNATPPIPLVGEDTLVPGEVPQMP